jgi:hypothetical protein
VKDAHLIAALERALHRYGSSDLPDDPATEDARPRRARSSRRRTPGWVSVREIEASQSPNTYPRMGRRDIKARCRQLASADGGPVLEVRSAGLRTWVRFAPTVPVTSEEPASAWQDVDGAGRGDHGEALADGGETDLGGVGHVDEPAILAGDLDLDLPDRP